MKENPVIPRPEQETVVQISRETNTANVYTTDSRYINKLDKLYPRSKVHKNNRRIVAVEYDIPAKNLTWRKLSVRKNSKDKNNKG